MVLIWTGLAGGDEQYCAILVAVNSILQMVLYAPLAILFVNVISRGGAQEVSYSVVARSVGVFLGIPLGAAIITRMTLRLINAKWYENTFLKWISPLSLIGLLVSLSAKMGWMEGSFEPSVSNWRLVQAFFDLTTCLSNDEYKLTQRLVHDPCPIRLTRKAGCPSDRFGGESCSTSGMLFCDHIFCDLACNKEARFWIQAWCNAELYCGE